MKITHTGLIDSLRKDYADGIKYFGYQEESTNEKLKILLSDEESIIDFILLPIENVAKEKYIGRYFQIFNQPIVLSFKRLG